MSFRLAVMAVGGLLVIAIAACGSDDAIEVVSQGPLTAVVLPGALIAEVCTEGEARDTRLYVRNLDDFDWGDITLSLVKSNETYTRKQALLPPETQQAAEPFADPSEFKLPFGGRALVSLSNLERAIIKISDPRPGDWTGEVHPCR